MMKTAGAALIAALLAGNVSAADDGRTYTSPTFGFQMETEAPSQAEQDQIMQRSVAEMMRKADRDMERRKAGNELKRQEALLYVALQKLNGKTPVYGEEKEDLEKIVTDSRKKIAQLKREYGELITKQEEDQMRERDEALRRTGAATAAEAAGDMLRGKSVRFYSGSSGTDSSDTSEGGFFGLSGNSGNQGNVSESSFDTSAGTLSLSGNDISALNEAAGAAAAAQNRQMVNAVDNVIRGLNSTRGISAEEEEEEEQITAQESLKGLMSPDDLLHSEDGLLIPNQPLNLPMQTREELRKIVENSLASGSGVRMQAYQRDMLNALLFNYGLQVLDDGRVIILDTYIPGAGQSAEGPMLAPGIPMPDGARQVVRAPVQQMTDSGNAILIPDSEFSFGGNPQ